MQKFVGAGDNDGRVSDSEVVLQNEGTTKTKSEDDCSKCFASTVHKILKPKNLLCPMKSFFLRNINLYGCIIYIDIGTLRILLTPKTFRIAEYYKNHCNGTNFRLVKVYLPNPLHYYTYVCDKAYTVDVIYYQGQSVHLAIYSKMRTVRSKTYIYFILAQCGRPTSCLILQLSPNVKACEQ